MSETGKAPFGPDLAAGVPVTDVPLSGVLAGHVDGSPVLLARLDDGFFAVSGACTHYGAPLAQGLVVDGVVHCPWHHACFSLRTGAVLAAPAFASLSTWQVDVVDTQVFVRGEVRTEAARPAAPAAAVRPERIVILGGGAAAFAAAEKLRGLGFDGALAMLSRDDDAPCDRPNLSKDYLAGTASEDWIPLQSPEFYREQRIDLHLGCDVVEIDTQSRRLLTHSGENHPYDELLIATGAEPTRIALADFDRTNVFGLRTLADARAIIAAAGSAKSVALIGAGFISLEAAASLRARGLTVHVIARETVPMERVLGRELGQAITELHQDQGVVFHFKSNAQSFDGRQLMLDDGMTIAADFVVVGIGVKPRIELAQKAGLAVGDGVLVNEFLQTSVAHVNAAGDVARFPRGADSSRIEHWVVAQRQGQFAAANMLGLQQRFDAVPFFWTHHYDLELRYVGHAESWDEIRVDGSIAQRDCTARFLREGKLLAAACIGRDLESLQIEAELLGATRAAGAWARPQL